MRVASKIVVASVVAIAVTACTAFLRAGHVEGMPGGRKLVMPVQTGQHEATGWTKSMEPVFLRKTGSPRIELVIVLSAHAREIESYLPTPCDRVVVSSTPTDGVGSATRYEFHGGGREVFSAEYATTDLEAFAKDGAVLLELCDYKYRFNGSSFRPLLD